MSMTDDMLTELEALSVFAALAAGYRQKLEDAGFTRTVAECIAAQYLIELQGKTLRGPR